MIPQSQTYRVAETYRERPEVRSAAVAYRDWFNSLPEAEQHDNCTAKLAYAPVILFLEKGTTQ